MFYSFFFFDVKALEQLHLFSDGLKCNSGYCIKCGENQLLSEGLCAQSERACTFRSLALLLSIDNKTGRPI